MQINVSIRKIFSRKDNGWIAAVADTSDHKRINIIGVIPYAKEGESYSLIGEWSVSNEYGSRFKVERSSVVLPVTKEGIIKYLSSSNIRGIGQKTAERIVEYFGKDSISILDNDPERILEIPGIKKKKLATIIEDWKEESFHRNTMMYLNSLGISQAYAIRIINKYMLQTVNIVKNEPYRLSLEIPGIGFKIADSIARRVGIKEDAVERIIAAIIFTMNENEEDGNCFITQDQLKQKLETLLNIDDLVLSEIYPKTLNLMVLDKIIVHEYLNETSIYFKKGTYLKEVFVANKLKQLINSKFKLDQASMNIWIEEFYRSSGVVLSEEQELAVKEAISNKVFILTGGPGVGKTTTANAIINILTLMGKTVALAAPTGRAAKRLTEVSGIEAKTIHRLLEWNPIQSCFKYNNDNKLAIKVIVLDETSMVDIHLAYSLLSALEDDAQIIFIGDKDQLPSVGAGNFFRDIIESGVIPCVVLKKIFRQASHSSIVRTAHAINRGELVGFNDDPDSDCRFVRIMEPSRIKEAIRILVSKKIPEQYGFDPVRDIQVLSPMKKGEIGTDNLNQILRSVLNKEESTERRGFKKGDKVIQCSNNYNINIFNGDIGYVYSTEIASSNAYHNSFYDDEDGNKKLDKEKKTVGINFSDRLVGYSDSELEELKLAYAITIHKSQGSEFPVVVIPVSKAHFIMLERNLFYTAITRAKKLVVFVGSEDALNYAIKNQSSKLRQTTLQKRLIDSNYDIGMDINSDSDFRYIPTELD